MREEYDEDEFSDAIETKEESMEEDDDLSAADEGFIKGHDEAFDELEEDAAEEEL